MFRCVDVTTTSRPCQETLVFGYVISHATNMATAEKTAGVFVAAKADLHIKCVEILHKKNYK